jgi:pyroglutamyl-peptidase
MSAVNDTSTSSSADVSFVVTGFGPFQNSKDNPTTVISKKVKEYVKNSDLDLQISSTLVIETSAEAAQHETDQLKEQFLSEEGITVMLHLGVNFKGKHFQLEQCAYNEAHFRIPDEKGYQPRNKKVIDGCDPTLTTRLDVEKLQQEIGLESVVVSTDPGRFVCNYTYYCSLFKLQQCEGSVYSLFLHVPPFSTVPEEEQLRVVTIIMKAIREQLLVTAKA